MSRRTGLWALGVALIIASFPVAGLGGMGLSLSGAGCMVAVLVADRRDGGDRWFVVPVRRCLTAASVLWVGLVIYLCPRIPLAALNWLLVVSVIPWAWLLWAFCRASAYQHAAKWARDIDKVHNGGRPRPLPAEAERAR